MALALRESQGGAVRQTWSDDPIQGGILDAFCRELPQAEPLMQGPAGRPRCLLWFWAMTLWPSAGCLSRSAWWQGKCEAEGEVFLVSGQGEPLPNFLFVISMPAFRSIGMPRFSKRARRLDFCQRMFAARPFPSRPRASHTECHGSGAPGYVVTSMLGFAG